MSTAVESATASTSPQRRPQGDAEARGQLTVADRVVEKVAARAVTEVDGAVGAPPTLLGQPLGRTRADTPARTSATVDGEVVSVEVSMGVEYPRSVREVAAAVRHHLMERIGELTGLRVAEVDIEVARLVRIQDGGRVR